MLKTIVSTFHTVMGSSLSLSSQSAVDTISHWRAKPDHELIFDSGRRDVRHYFEAVDRLRQPSPPPSGAPRVGFTAELVSIAMARLRHEFGAVLDRWSDSQAVAPVSTTESTFATDSTAYLFRYEEYVAHEPPNDDVVAYLRNIAQRMSSNDDVRECVDVYRRVRRNFLQGQLKRLRFEELSSSALGTRRHTWDELKVKMESWAQVCKICVKILFEMEKKLCHLIFQGLVLVDDINSCNNYAEDLCFVGTVQDFAFSLFSFVVAEAIINQPYERMVYVLGVYSAFVWVLPSANALFSSELGLGIRNKCSEILSVIEQDSARMLHDFERCVLNEVSIYPVDNRGSVCQLTTYVTEQIAIIEQNRDLLANLIKRAPSFDFGDLAEDTSGRNFLETHVILIVSILLTNLDSKRQAHTNSSSGLLFMANNFQHVLQRIEGSEGLRRMVGESYVAKLVEGSKAALGNFVGSACAGFEACFEDKGLYVTWCCKPRLSRSAVRRRIRDFNRAYEEFRALGLSWVVPDPEMRNELRCKLHENLVQAYADFLDNLRSSSETSFVFKYSAEDFKVLIWEELFKES
ncbi:exocyst subunit exo70 family protein D1 [Striga hermonthica]|uniref:Exocyst subunit Exo70 family protein n=1 Tax=Striga hermonthica TaxID=68872 RepID=A0A9N7RGE9_STRHE|nr:exocyst subunit exo70 family protein D1 [Striga hermonthica]